MSTARWMGSADQPIIGFRVRCRERRGIKGRRRGEQRAKTGVWL